MCPQELEDDVCDMALAVAGTRSGITAAHLTTNTAGALLLQLKCKYQIAC